MTLALKEIVGELSGLSEERQRVAASVIHALWAEENVADGIHPEWRVATVKAAAGCTQSKERVPRIVEGP